MAQVGRAASFPSPTTGPDRPLEIANLFPGQVESETLSAWVLEPAPPAPPAGLFASPSNDFGPSIANRNSNPLNIKLGSHTRQYVQKGLATVSDVMPKDGGRFLRFDDPETGFRAAMELLSAYGDLRLDGALRRWSNKGYGAEILAGTAVDAAKALPSLGRDDLRILLYTMASAEGYRSSTVADEIRRALTP